jgi:hypothetical protein
LYRRRLKLHHDEEHDDEVTNEYNPNWIHSGIEFGARTPGGT